MAALFVHKYKLLIEKADELGRMTGEWIAFLQKKGSRDVAAKVGSLQKATDLFYPSPKK